MHRITVDNIEEYRGGLTISSNDLKCDVWDIFDKSEFENQGQAARIVSLRSVVSTKDQRADPKFLAGFKADPRLVALGHMQSAASGKGKRRAPITVCQRSDGLFDVVDGNATIQVLMMAMWNEVPVCVIAQG